ncbi:hypothetical protein [Paenibacillus cucumis (ex Kampfer et al. 2016)]|uniref:DUF465 domain-containing protein n=1 Tax=Paenibacillus cucumis (ex Kampfer et al. 2016) TaxID=1776858 RepID=A0ABS7KFL2_9BACL|nr:hypothetical protein [Paenibacillus cucumis (ex Kampfer et al. 2016)]MBY0202736.1 hypothetical protein [Paenibacillus cucumis (ex Kampfer et al. 2016)]
MGSKRSSNELDGNNGLTEARHELQLRLIVAEKQIAAKEPLMDHELVMNRLKRKIEIART